MAIWETAVVHRSPDAFASETGSITVSVDGRMDNGVFEEQVGVVKAQPSSRDGLRETGARTYEDQDGEEGDDDEYVPDVKLGLLEGLAGQRSFIGTPPYSSLRRSRTVLFLSFAGLTLLAAFSAASIYTVVYRPGPHKSHSVLEIVQDLPSNKSTGTDDLLEQEALRRLREEGYIPVTTTHSSPFQPVRRALVPTSAQVQFSYECAEAWIAHGELCESLTKQPTHALSEPALDVVWTWVTPNKHWSSWRERFQKGLARLRKRRIVGQTIDVPRYMSSGDKHYRSHRQLQYSQRSVRTNLPWTRKFHVVASDLPACDPSEESCTTDFACRIGQVPDWLDEKKLTPSSQVDVQFHWNLFKSNDRDSNAWRTQTLPNFDSLAIESQLSNLRNVTEQFLYMNDDFYVIRDMSPADFSSPLFGPVYRIQKDLGVSGEAPGTSRQRIDGEWPSMTYSDWLLDQRFGIRSRSYLFHQGKMMSRPLLDEVASIWAQELRATAEVRFRGKAPELNTLLLATYYTIEKHREALLWSYFVARMDSARAGRYNAADRAAILQDLGGSIIDDAIKVSRPHRPAYTDAGVKAALSKAHLQIPTRTPYSFTSMDGYAFISLGQPASSWPVLDNAVEDIHYPALVCSILVDQCFGGTDYFQATYTGDTSTESLFKRVAFEQPQCGDCIIPALLGKAQKGLDAFLPKASQSAGHPKAAKRKNFAPPMLGDLAKSWQQGDFTLRTLSNSQAWKSEYNWELREYCIRLLQRYSYAIGATPSQFHSMRSPLRVIQDLKALRESLQDDDGPAFVALNDDIAKFSYVKIVDANLARWHEEMWPNKTSIEREVSEV